MPSSKVQVLQLKVCYIVTTRSELKLTQANLIINGKWLPILQSA